MFLKPLLRRERDILNILLSLGLLFTGVERKVSTDRTVLKCAHIEVVMEEDVTFRQGSFNRQHFRNVPSNQHSYSPTPSPPPSYFFTACA